jgi:hypothetical protein
MAMSTGHWVLTTNTGHRILATGHWTHDTALYTVDLTLDTWTLTLAPGHRTLETEHWKLNIVYWNPGY